MFRLSLPGEPEAKPSPEVLVLTGPSGAGKGTVGEKVMEFLAYEEPEWDFSRSWTTRRIRPGEDPRSYNFVTEEAFREKIENGGFLEWAQFGSNLYGTPIPADPDRKLLVEIEVNGARQIHDLAFHHGSLGRQFRCPSRLRLDNPPRQRRHHRFRSGRHLS